MSLLAKDLWSLVWGRPQVDPLELADAVQEEVGQAVLDFRTRLLVRDSLNALQKHWGDERLGAWLSASPVREKLAAIWQEELGDTGFAALQDRIMEKTEPETIRQYLRELGTHLNRPARLLLGGSAALILPGRLSRATDDIDVVDEVPSEIRALHSLLDQLKQRFGLRLAHFQSHYLPAGWDQRLHSLGAFGQLHVFLVDVYDVVLSKLFSAREKDRDDLRILLPQLSKESIVQRLQESAAALMGDAAMRQKAEKNWYILFGESLPTKTDQGPSTQEHDQNNH
jgi:hypothetical protein